MKKFLAFLLTFIFTFSFPPFTCLAQNQTELWGMTVLGGNGGGVIFKTDGKGENQQLMHLFLENPGERPNSDLCQASNGKLYGMTKYGGAINKGVLFEYDPATSTSTKKFDFVGTNGTLPCGSLMHASNGKLYGMTSFKGANDKGVLFEYDPATNTYTKKLDFAGATNGSLPQGSLMQASNGKLYGMTFVGGANNIGVLFEYDLATSTYTKKLDFAGTTNGAEPVGSLIQASNGKLYGMTPRGGANNIGVLFEYDSATNTCTKKLDFAGAANGSHPSGSLMQASNGKLYGMAVNGGANNIGVLFEYDPGTSTCTKKLDFTGAANGSNPMGSLMQASNGNLYGMTYLGGANNKGVLFEYDPTTDSYTKRLDFTGATNGSSPYGSLMQASDEKLYGMTYAGGANDEGVIFEYDPATITYTKKLDFATAINGNNPSGSLLQASSGKLYGMTSYGGANNYGVLFEFDTPTRTFTKKLDFNGTNGKQPSGSLIQAYNGKLYGMTIFGGANDFGVLFEYDPATNSYTKKLDFNGTNGRNPWDCSLMQSYNGKLYGIIAFGGANNMGVLFEYDPATSTYTKKYDFVETSGGEPFGSLLQTSNGKLYGTASYGGANNFGVLFEYDPATLTYTKKLDFAVATYGGHYGSMIQASNRKLYGMTSDGGANNAGVLFEYDPATNIYIKKLDFDGTNGKEPFGSLMQASNQKMYGMTNHGGTNDVGVLFEYDPATATCTKKLDFDGANGMGPHITQLIEQPGISAGPYDAAICSGSWTSFSITANGIGLSFQWQVNSGSGFTDIVNNSIYSNATTNTLKISNAPTAMNLYQFRCVVSSTFQVVSILSDTAILNLDTLPIGVGEISGNSNVCQGQNSVTYTVLPIANATSYIWTLPAAGATGTSTTSSITLNFGLSSVSGNIIVKGNSTCGVGGESYFPVFVNPKPETPSISQNDIILHSNALNGNQWCDQNGLINGENSQDYTVTANGNYYVIVTDDGCRSEPSNSINVVITGIESTKSDKSIKIYPNPVSDELIIEVKGGTDITGFEIFNSTGQLVLKGTLVERTVVPTTNFSPGIYIIKIENGKNL